MDAALKLYRSDGTQVNVGGTKAGAVKTFKHIPDFAALAAQGKVWGAMDTTTTVALVARPSTTASLTIQNPPTSNTYKVILSYLMYTDVVPASLMSVALWVCVHKLAVALLTRDLVLTGTGAGTATSFKGGVAYGGDLVIDRGVTVIDDGWIPVGEPLVSNIASTNFIAKEFPARVPVVLPPGMHMSLQTTSTVTTTESALGVIWAEVEEDELFG